MRPLRILAVLTAALLAHSAGAEPPEPARLSLGDAVAQALRENPAARGAEAGRGLAGARVREARAGWLPRVEVSSTFARSNNPVYVFGSLLEQERFTADRFAVDKLNDPDPVNNLRTEARVQLPLFDQLQTPARLEQARRGQEQSERQAEAVDQRLRFEVVRAYFGAVLAEAREQVARDTVKTAEAGVTRVRNLRDAGMVVESDLLASEVQLSEFRQQEIEASGDTAVAHAGLDAVLGVPVSRRHLLTGTLAERSFEVAAEEDLLRSAAQRPDLAGAGAQVRAAEQGVRLAEGQYLPRLDAFADYGASGEDLSVDSTDWMVGARLTYPLFDGGRGARLDQARSGVAAAAAERDQAANRAGLEVVQAHRRFLAARERLQVAKGAEGQAAEALRIVQDRYQAGLTTITEVLRAESARQRARFNELAARYGLYVSYAEVRLASGTLRDVEAFGP